MKNIIAKRRLREFWERAGRADSEQQLRAWHHFAKRAGWTNRQDVKNDFGNASIIANNRVVFNICGNKYRLVVAFNYRHGFGYVRFIGTHGEYDKIDAATI